MKKLLLATAILTSLMATSCKKKGCIDSQASNYDEKAKKDDGTCTFAGDVVFWIGQTESIALTSSGVAELNVYVDNVKVGDQGSNVFHSSNPGCGAATVITKAVDLGTAKTKVVNYKVIDEDDVTHYSGTVTVVPGCTDVQMN